MASAGLFDWRVSTPEAKVRKELVVGLIEKMRAPQTSAFPEAVTVAVWISGPWLTNATMSATDGENERAVVMHKSSTLMSKLNDLVNVPVG